MHHVFMLISCHKAILVITQRANCFHDYIYYAHLAYITLILHILRSSYTHVTPKELKQRITAIAAKVRRYQGQVDSYRQNKLFENNQRQFYRELDQEEERCDDDQPVAEESKQFWENMESVCRP